MLLTCELFHAYIYVACALAANYLCTENTRTIKLHLLFSMHMFPPFSGFLEKENQAYFPAWSVNNIISRSTHTELYTFTIQTPACSNVASVAVLVALLLLLQLYRHAQPHDREGDK